MVCTNRAGEEAVPCENVKDLAIVGEERPLKKFRRQNQKALDVWFKPQPKLGPVQSGRSKLPDKKRAREIADMFRTQNKRGRPKKTEETKRRVKGRLGAGIKRQRTEPGAVHRMEYLRKYEDKVQELGSKTKARMAMMKELQCSESFLKGLVWRKEKNERKAEEVGKFKARKSGREHILVNEAVNGFIIHIPALLKQ
jgi:hypothetical protein